MNLSNTKIKGQFKWKTVYNIKFTINNCLLLEDIVDINNNCVVLLDSNNYDTIHKIENILRHQLLKENSFLKSSVSNQDNNQKSMSFKLKFIKKQLKTEFFNKNGEIINYNMVKKNIPIKIHCSIESIWSHNKYYPNFIYKIIAQSIQLLE